MPIGNYIHLRASSIKQEELNSADASLKALKTKMINDATKSNKIDNQTLQKLGEELNTMRGLLVNPQKDSDFVTRLNITNTISDFIEQSIKATIDSIDWSTGRVTIKQNTTAGIGRIQGNMRWQPAQNAQNALSRFAKLYQQTMGKSGSLSLTSLKKIVAEAKKVQGNLNDAAQESLQRLNNLHLSNQNIESSLKNGINQLKQKKYNFNDRDLQLLIRTINDSIRLLTPIYAYQLAQGNLFEAMLSALDYVREGYANKTGAELVKTVLGNIKGGERATVAYKTSNFNKNIADKLFSRTMGEYSLMAQASPTQGKVDVMISRNSLETGDIIKLNISAKSVNLNTSHGWIHTVSNTSLLTMLQDENSDYVNHYVNLFAYHIDEENDNKLNRLRQSYTKLTNFLIAIKALTGEVTRISDKGIKVDDSANVFVVNNVSTGEISIYSMASIKEQLMKICEQATEGQLSGGSNVISIKYSQTRFKNDFVEGNPDTAKWIRVANVLSDVHATKISASINISSIKI